MSKSRFKPLNLNNIITHGNENPPNLDKYRSILKSSDNLSLPLEMELSLLEQLSEFDLGKFLLKNQGLNGYWSSYVISGYREKRKLHILEKWIIRKSLLMVANRERADIFTEQLHKYLEDNITLASIPCGLMDDLLHLDYTADINMQLIGVDLDQKAINLAKVNALKNNLINCTKFVKKDAWNLGVNNQYNIISSNGLNICEPNDQRIIKLYKEFYNALKPNGILITSFLTPPKELSENANCENFDEKDFLREKAIFSDILNFKWKAYRTEEQVREQLTKSGFFVMEVIYDSKKIFPTIVAKKII